MSTIVLVHGTWLGGWVWDRTAPLLRASGHDVHAPDLPGLGEHAHTVHEGLDHVAHSSALADYLDEHDLSDVVLVGHSYGGIVVQALADSARVATVVHIDAFLPDEGESAFDLLPWLADAFQPVDDERPWLIAPLDAGALGVTEPDDVAWIAAHAVPMPLATHTAPARAVPVGAPTTYVYCEGLPVMAEMVTRAEARGYAVRRIPTAHMPMVTHPALLAGVLDEIVTSPA